MPTRVYEPPIPDLTEPVLPINTLEQFLSEFRGLLDNIAYYWDQILFEKGFREYIRNAWSELRERIAGAINTLSSNNLLNPSNTETQGALDRFGLSGAQLRLKMKALDDAWSRFHDQGGSGPLREVLQVAILVLDSLSKVFPNVQAPLEALKEFSETVALVIGKVTLPQPETP